MTTQRARAVGRVATALLIVPMTLSLKGQAPAPTPLAVGAIPPKLQADSWVQGEGKPSWESLRGRVVVLDLWGTWCPPCVAEIPRWNKLVDDLAGTDGVAFVSIAIDDRDRLVEFLKDHPVKGLVGVDPEGRTHKSYGIPGVGYWVVVGKAGTVVAVTEPEHVTASVVAAAAAGRSIDVPGVVTDAANLTWDRELIDWKDGIAPLTQVIIKPVTTRTGGQWYRRGSNRFSADGVGLQPLLVFAYDVEFEQLDIRLKHNQTYRVSAVVPPGQEAQLRPLLREALKATVGFRVREEGRELDVYVLRRAKNISPTWRSADTDEPISTASGRRMLGRRQPVSELRGQLTMVLRKLVLDESGLIGPGNWDIQVHEDKPEMIIEEVWRQLSLRIEAARRPVKILVVESM
jgi:uncharacterized protein (TIGR03435 family)